MADTTLLLNGFSIIGDPQTNTNASGGGELMVHDGDAIFDGDDIIVFTVSNATVDGVLTGDSVITGIIVYDNATDYYYDTPKYEYTGTGDIDTGRNNMGDRYIEFDGSGLTSTDPNAPTLGQIAVVAGVDILTHLANNNGPLEIPTNEDIDLNGDGIITPDEESDGAFSSAASFGTFVCFAKGTLIETPGGPQFIETLKVGDLVNTLDDGPQPIRWIGHRSVPGEDRNAPVEIAAGTLGNIRRLTVSQNHRMLVTGAQAELLFGQAEVLVAAKHLVNGTTIRIAPRPQVTYYHFLCDAHQIVFAEGCPSETLLPGAEALATVDPRSRSELLDLLPRLEGRDRDGLLSRYTLTGAEAAAMHRVA